MLFRIVIILFILMLLLYEFLLHRFDIYKWHIEYLEEKKKKNILQYKKKCDKIDKKLKRDLKKLDNKYDKKGAE